MKKTTAHSESAPDESKVREAQAQNPDLSDAAGTQAQSANATAAAEEGQLPGPTPEELADPTLIYQENQAIYEKELAEVSDKYLRLAAEYDNFRRRSQKEKETLYTDSVALVIKEWLPVLDSLDRASQTVTSLTTDDIRPVAAGIELIQKQASEAMGRLGVNEIACLGQTFDPNLEEAVMHIEDDSIGASTVIEVFQKGYTRGERVIRHALVKVAN
ncbi:MAG: nucleotide exchange factor GrpE [Eubacteriales bacterium]|nr:nucleotide exchange factor GrpE [Eubacteriales bacterium]